MNLNETKFAFNQALRIMLENDKSLLERNLSERSIAHRLGVYLNETFPLFNIDCEYNGDVDSEGLRKILNIPREIMEELAVRSINDNDTYNIFPDIIVHERETNERNHLVIEIKKTNSYQKLREYDLIKLKEFTNQYRYNLGIYLELGTGRATGAFEVLYFQNGEQKEEEQLLDF
ncbi:hypothetical protein [Chryseobacterium sp.]|uniref:hypothetical protein n=1 Tax=Chryseobacterium sp. TaxID=1871047 RepID=UPI0025BAD4B5|nr:hypothetical protein [Chryseobacterium sp.]